MSTERRPRFAIAATAAFFIVLYTPIAVVVLFSFNAQKSLAVFDGFSLRWYEAFLADEGLIESLGMSLRVSAVAMAGSVAHIASARVQRGEKAQPGGRLIGDGGAPGIWVSGTPRCCRRGAEPISPRV